MDTVLSGPKAVAFADTKNLSKPLFQQVSDHIWSDIASAKLTAHTPLPSERDVAEQYGVSRVTARRALEWLEQKGLVYSSNRIGRFISPKRFKYDISRGYNFFLDAKARGVQLTIEVLEKKKKLATDEVATKLNIPVSEPIFEYTRIFKSKGHPIFIETEHLVAARFPGFLENDLNQSTTRLFETKYKTFAQTGDIVIRMRSIDAREASWLGIPDGQSSIELKQVISDQSGTPFCYGKLLWRGELTEFVAQTVVARDAAIT